MKGVITVHSALSSNWEHQLESVMFVFSLKIEIEDSSGFGKLCNIFVSF